MSSLHINLAAWNAAANPTNSRVTAVATCENGLVCGHADGNIWLYGLIAGTAVAEKDGKEGEELSGLQLRPKSLLAGHQSPIVLLKLAEIDSPTADGSEGAIVSVSEDGDVIVWGTKDGRCISRIRTPMQDIRPEAAVLQRVDYESAGEDLLFISGEGGVVYVLNYPSLQVVYEWQLPHLEWISALAVRKRKDHFRSELIACTRDGVVRIWSYDEFGLSQNDVFSRATSPTLPNMVELGLGVSSSGSAAESVSSDTEADNAGGGYKDAMLYLESTFASFGEEHAITSLTVNPYNDDEFLAVSPGIVRLFASRENELHELLRWKAQKHSSSAFVGAGFLAKSDIIFWDALGNIFSVCSSFTVAGGSAGMHLTRGLHTDQSREASSSIISGLDSVRVGPDSVFGNESNRSAGRVNAFASYTSDKGKHALSVLLPAPLSSISGSANKPRAAGDDTRGGLKTWLGKPLLFAMDSLWSEWIAGVASKRDATCALVTNAGKIALGYDDGAVRISAPMALIGSECSPSSSADESSNASQNTGSLSLDLYGHTSAVTALYEWATLGSGSCEHRSQWPGGEGHAQGDKCADCSHSILVSAGKDLTVRIWDVATGECLNVLPAQSAPIVQLRSLLPSKAVAWKDSDRHRDMERFLKTHILGIASDNSNTLISMETLERVCATPPYHEQLVRLSLRGDTGDLVLNFADDSKQSIGITQLLAARQHLDDESQGSAGYPSYSVSLVRPRSASGTGTASPSLQTSDGTKHWASVHLLSPAGRGNAGSGAPSALLMDIEVTQLQSVVSKAIPEGTSTKEVKAALQQEAREIAVSKRTATCDVKSALQPLHTSLMLLSALFTWGISDELDSIKRHVFCMQPPLSHVSLSISNRQKGTHTVLFPDPSHRHASWCVSPLLNSQRMLAILVLSRGILQGNEQKAVEIINFYVGKLPGEIGQGFKPLSLLALAQYWQSPNTNLQRAARTLFLSAINGAPEKLRRTELFFWTSVLARCTPGIVNAEELCALTIVCVIGSDFPSLLPLTARSMAASMLQSLIVSDRAGVRARMVATELLARGFNTFKPYLDCQLVIQCLLGIMMSISEDGLGVGTSATSSSVLGAPTTPTTPTTPTASSLANGSPNAAGLGIHRSMSGASLQVLASDVGGSAPGSRKPSLAGGSPTPIPASVSKAERPASLAATPANTVSSIARAALTSSAMRTAGTHAQKQQRLLKLGCVADDDTGHYSDSGLPGNIGQGTADPSNNVYGNNGGSKTDAKDTQQKQHSVHSQVNRREQQHSTRKATGNGSSSEAGGTGAVSFVLIVLAKSALLRICAADTSLIVSSITNLLQNGESIRERRGALQLIGLVTQKYPTHIYPYLEGLVAAVVQAIEPKRATVRKMLIGAAGAALQGLVKTYPWVSFHPESQCLVVGCIDGRCTTYDLRTATRTAVYDSGAGSPVAAVSISPRGDRVASFTVGDGVLSIWDPAPSALAMFARSLFWSSLPSSSDHGADGAGAGADAGTVSPHKTMRIPADFLGRADELPISSVMAVARLKWTADRTVLLQIQDASFSLSV